MKPQIYNVIGVMSGTSLDGIDLAHIRFEVVDNKWNFEILECETVGYSSLWVQTLQQAVGFDEVSLLNLNENYTTVLAHIVDNFIWRNELKNLDAVCSHGHTVLHQPEKGLTLQIGNLPQIAQLIAQKVVCDFRVADVALGGQGAPLVPIGDRMLFGDYNYCLNLGGFSNISFEQNGSRIAFDICAVNTVLNHYALQLGQPYDDAGKWARSGKLNKDLMRQLNSMAFYHLPHPKSLGFETVKTVILPLLDRFAISAEDKMHTFTEHIAQQIAAALPDPTGKMLVTGGGAYNIFLIQKMQQLLPKLQIVIPETKILEFKEALIFALLGVLKLRGEINVLASVTGAAHDHSSGKIFNSIDFEF